MPAEDQGFEDAILDAKMDSAAERGDGAVNALLTGQTEEDSLTAEDNAVLDTLLESSGMKPDANVSSGAGKPPTDAQQSPVEGQVDERDLRGDVEPEAREDRVEPVPPELIEEAAHFGISAEDAEALGPNRLSGMLMRLSQRIREQLPAEEPFAPPERVRPSPESTPTNGASYKPGAFNLDKMTAEELQSEFQRLHEYHEGRYKDLHGRLENYERMEVARAAARVKADFNAALSELEAPDLFGDKPIEELGQYSAEAIRQNQVLNYVQGLAASRMQMGQDIDSVKSLTKVAARGLFPDYFERRAVERAQKAAGQNAKQRMHRPSRRNRTPGTNPRAEAVAGVRDMLREWGLTP